MIKTEGVSMPNGNDDKKVGDALDLMEKRIKEVALYTDKLINHFKWTIITLGGVVTIFIGLGAPKIIRTIAESKVEEITENMVKMEINRLIEDEKIIEKTTGDAVAKELEKIMPDIIDQIKLEVGQKQVQEKPMQPSKASKVTVDQLIKDLQGGDWQSRAEAAVYLGERKAKQDVDKAIKALEERLTHEKDYLVINAIEKALRKLKQ